MKSKKSVFNIVSMAGYDGGVGMVRWKGTYLQHGRINPLIVCRKNIFRSFPDTVDWVGIFHALLPVGITEVHIEVGEKVTSLLKYWRHTDMYITRARVSLMERMDRSEEFN